MTAARHVLQWALAVIGCWLHGPSIGTLPTDDDTKADWPANLQLDRKDADGNRSDGLQDAWWRFWHEGWRRMPHNLKNVWREWIEVVHPKTAARVSGAIALGSLGLGILIGGALGWALARWFT